MSLPLTVTSRNIDLTQDVEDEIIARAQDLENFHRRIRSCTVLVEAPARVHAREHPFHVRIDLIVPGGEIVVNRAPPLHRRDRHTARDRHTKRAEIHLRQLKTAVHASFDAVEQMLEDHGRDGTGPDHGFIETPGREGFPGSGVRGAGRGRGCGGEIPLLSQKGCQVKRGGMVPKPHIC